MLQPLVLHHVTHSPFLTAEHTGLVMARQMARQMAKQMTHLK
jgi:hypothetical protein